MLFNDVVGKTFKFYGVHDTFFKIGRHIFEAIEDENDGYRSYLDSVEARKDEKLVFLGRSFATVVVEEECDGCFDGYVLRDTSDNHIWLKFGTNNTDDYYPYFVFEYQTKLEVAKRVERKAAREDADHTRGTVGQRLALVQKALKDGRLEVAQELLNDLANKM
jgi:hypothetical protein